MSRASIPKRINRPDVETRAPMKLVEMPTSIIDPLINQHNSYLRYYRLGECSVVVTKEFGEWHLSIAHPRRYPTWDEISEARYRIIPDEVTMAMILPPKAEYVNVHRFCFQMVEIPPR